MTISSMTEVLKKMRKRDFIVEARVIHGPRDPLNSVMTTGLSLDDHVMFSALCACVCVCVCVCGECKHKY